ncbi:hypothetical protein HPB48_004359 [Haemaphysalis longicornis]|uniref:Uncharacterized protein n=1 Tax=Haemaphysalis longicornis TaxID=44386 RepID=A0A9J6G3B2_HAELO|nr:hypothetical protein HPB48_004359 [Haemaphysalis longicornis]
MVSGVLLVLLILLVLNLFILSSVGGDWERARKASETTTTEMYVSYVAGRRQEERVRHTCRTEACAAAANNVSLDRTADPLHGPLRLRLQPLATREEDWEVRRDRHTVDHLHQAALSRALHQILAGPSDRQWLLPEALQRLYRKCLEPGPDAGAQLRAKLLDSAGVAPWPQPRIDTANSEDVSKVLGNAYYFTNEPTLLRMGVGSDGRVFLAEPRLLLDAPAAGPNDMALAAAAAFRPLLNGLTASGEANFLVHLADAELSGGRQRVASYPQSAAKISQSAWASWNLRTVVEEAFEPHQALDDVVVRAPGYMNALPDVLKEIRQHELLNYLGMRTALLASRLLPPGPEKQLLCRLIDEDDAAPAQTDVDHCVRMIAKYEPAMTLYMLANQSPLVSELDAQALLRFLRAQLSSLVRSGALESGPLSSKMADRADALPWEGLAPDWLGNASARNAYVARFYGDNMAPASSQASQAVFSWMQEKVVNEHLALNEPNQFVNARWAPGLMSTRCRLVTREEETVATGGGNAPSPGDAAAGPEATLQVPPAALDLLWGTDRSTAMFQIARVGVRAFEPVLRHLFRWQQEQHLAAEKPPGRSLCSSWLASSDRLDEALESWALSLALRAYMAWPGAPELMLPGLEHLEPEQLFFVFYTLNQCEVNGPDMEQILATRLKARGAVLLYRQYLAKRSD